VVPPHHIDEEVTMMRFRSANILLFLVIGFASAAIAGDLVVDGAITTTGGWFGFADGSIQNSAAYARWEQVAVVDIQGRGDYMNPVTAMAALPTWCGTPSASNPCLVKILPGRYDIGTSSLAMQPHVDIEGSGRDATFIRAASSAATVYGANNAELRSLTVINDGDGGSPKGIEINDALQRPLITNVDVVVEGANTDNTGVYIIDSMPMIDSMGVVVNGGDTALGINIVHSSGELHNVDVDVTTVGGDVATGIDVSINATPLLKDSQIYASEGASCYGIQSTQAGPRIDGVSVVVAAESAGWGFQSVDSPSRLSNSFIQVIGGGSNTGVLIAGSYPTVRGTRIEALWASDSTTGVEIDDYTEARLEQVNIIADGGAYTYAVSNRGHSDAALINVTAEANLASSYNYGVLNQDGAQITAANLIAAASGGSGSYGVLNADNGGALTIDRSTVTGASASVRNDNSSADFFVGTSKLDGPVSTNLTCFGNYDASYGAVSCP
jgi:hypothetical protein